MCEPELCPRVGGCKAGSLAEIGQGILRLTATYEYRCEIALGQWIIGGSLHDTGELLRGFIVPVESGECDAERDTGVCVGGIEFERMLKNRDGLLGTTKLGQAQPVVVRHINVGEHRVQCREHRQSVGEEAVLQQAEHIVLGFDAIFRHR